MKVYKILILLLTLCFQVILVFSNTYITEIDFLNSNYIEIYSNNKLNLSNNYIFDEGGFDKLEQIKFTNSPIYLIVSNNFLEINNISKLNVTIYKTNKNKIGYYSLKNSGENISIQINNSFNLTYKSSNNLVLNNNQTLNFDIFKLKYFIDNQTVGILNNITNINTTIDINNYNLFNLENDTNFNSNQNTTFNSNQTNLINTTNQTKILNYNLSIITNSFIFEDKIKFEFNHNYLEDFIIEYWIENYNKIIVKNKLNTTNKNLKSYTPSKNTEIYYIKANLYSKNLTLISNTSKQILYYQNSVETENTKKQNSYISIINYEDLKKLTSDNLEFEIFKSEETTKKIVNIICNNEKINSFEIDKSQTIKGKIKLCDYDKNYINISISGLDLITSILIFKNNSLNIYPSNNNNTNNNDFISDFQSNSNIEFFNFKNFSIINNSILFSINKSNHQFNSICYIREKNTLVSEELKDNFSNLILNINKSKLSLIQSNNYSLKLYCKYKKISLSTFKYVSKDFNFSYINLDNNFNKTNTIFLENKTNYSNFSNFNNSNNILISNKNKNNLQLISILENKTNYLNYNNKDNLTYNISNTSSNKDENLIYSSENQKNKTNSFFLVFIALVILFIISIFY